MKSKILFLLLLSSIILISSCDKEVSTSPVEEKPPQGFIYVDSNPKNFKIYLDGRFTGRFTPDTLPYVEESEHLIELKRKYWLDSSAITTAESEIVKSIYIDFMKSSKSFGTLEFDSNPENALIEINDSLTTLTTPNKLSGLIPGVYNIKYHLDEHRSIFARRIVESNKTTKITLALQDTSIWVDFTSTNSAIPNNHITALAVDMNNTLWAGTVNDGIVYIKGSKWTFLNISNSILPSNRIRAIEVDRNNATWIGTEEGLVEVKNGVIHRIFDVSNSALNKTSKINAINFYYDKIIAGTSEGLLQIDGDSTLLFKATNVDGQHDVTAIEVDEINGKVWVGVKGEMLTLEVKDGKIVFNPKSDNIGGSVFDLELAQLKLRPSDGKLWALFSNLSGVGQGGNLVHIPPYLTVWNGTKWSWQRLEANNLILTDVIVSNDDYVWITTNQGLRKQLTLRTANIFSTFNSGLFSNNLTSIVEDHDGTFWLGSVDGLFKYKKNLVPF